VQWCYWPTIFSVFVDDQITKTLQPVTPQLSIFSLPTVTSIGGSFFEVGCDYYRCG